MRMGIRVFDNLASTQDVKFERAVEVNPPVRLFWAHVAIHIHDELLSVMQVHTSFVYEFDPLPILR